MKFRLFDARTAAARQFAVVMVAGALAAGLLTACSDDEPRAYSVPKGSEVIATSGSPGIVPPQPGGAATSAGPGAVTPDAGGGAYQLDPDRTPWVIPAGWTEMPDNPPMRLATYLMPGPQEGGAIEVAISRFPGDVGGMLANVNRWRGQVGLPPIAEEEMWPMIEHFDTPGFHGHLIHIEGPQQHMLAASIFEHAADETWFVRVITDGETAAWAREDVYAFARTFGTRGGAASAAPPAGGGTY